MKRSSILVVLCLVAFAVYSQPGKGTFVASVSEVDRISLIKSSIDVPSWHERSFWPIYENYRSQAQEISSIGYRSLDELAKVDKSVSDQEALEHARQMLSNRSEMQALRKQYYLEVAKELNGIIALQFLQTEVLLDMMESSRIYEETYWGKFRFHPKAMTSNQFNAAKRNTISKALALTPEEATKFWNVYNQYVEDCDVLLGEDYSVVSLYAGEASDFTPALAKRLGYDFLQIMERESKLKQKYFEEMNVAVGPSLAARFLAWEDYYSLVSKMYAWADSQ